MSKTSQELASEITIAWINAVSISVANGKFSSEWISTDKVSDFYSKTVKTINETYNL